MAAIALLSRKHIQFIILYLLVSCECRSEEVYCSKFPYEQALLEKMVRMEFNMEKMNEDYKVKQDQMEQDLINVKGSVQTTNTELQTIFKKSRLDNENENGGIQGVLFRATDVADAHPAKDQIIVFNELHENLGTAYNNLTGVFTAPATGQYFFSVQFCSSTKDTREDDGSSGLHFAFVQDHGIKKPVSFYFDYFTCVTSTFVTSLTSGSRVWIKSIWDHPKTTLKSNEYLTNEFSGILVSK